MIDLFLEKNKVELPEKFEEKLDHRMKKLAFYFNENKEKFIEVVKNNPTMNFKKLIKLVKEERENKEQNELKEERLVTEVSVSEEKIEEKKEESK